DAELRSHLELLVAEKIRGGSPPAEARRAALLELGGMEQVKEDVRSSRPGFWLDAFAQDLRFGFRMLRKDRGFTVVAVLILALGIGAVTAVFTIADAIFLNPLPSVRDVARLVRLQETLPDGSCCNLPPANYRDLQQSGTFSDMAAYYWKDAVVVADAVPEAVTTVHVSPEFFGLVSGHPAMGRTFLPDEQKPGAHVVVLSHGFWQGRLGGDLHVLEKTLRLDGEDYSVVGVMRRDFDYPAGAELWMPLGFSAADWASRSPGRLAVIARLAPGFTIGRTQNSVNILAARIALEYPNDKQASSIHILDLRNQINGNLTPLFTMTLLGAAFFFLLLACSNVANLQLARASARRQEFAVRSTLGAGRGRIVRHLITENLLLALLGGCVGLVFAQAALQPLSAAMPPETARQIAGWSNLQINSRVLLFAFGITLLAVLLSGLAPALRIGGSGLASAISDAGRKVSASPASQRLRSVFVAAQVSLTLILLVGAGLMIRGLYSMLAAAGDFEPATLYTMRVILKDARYPDARRRASFYEQALARLGAIPGVSSACLFSSPPLSNNEVIWWTISVPGQSPGATREGVILQTVSPGYFQTSKIVLHAGRDFSDQDTATSLPVAVVSKNLARRVWPGSDPLGRQLKLGPSDSKEPWLTVVGVAPDIEFDWTDNQPELAVYVPYRQSPPPMAYLALRASAKPADIIHPVRRAIAAVDPDLPLYEFHTLERGLSGSIGGLLCIGGMMTALGFIGLFVAVIGVFGVMSFAVGQRTREIGIRMALGARPGDVLRLVFRRGSLLCGIGLLLGLLGSLALARLVGAFFFGVSPFDPSTFMTVAGVLTASALLACYIPARRATRVDPAVALRYE
ncbi:MAG TPA: ABC transporter permease, partial [Methylomirabilota bacterium]|nr:ABC transporter permease [Methylomirabilota bacterium]